MDRGGVLLAGLRGKLQGWLPTIQRGTGATSVTFIPHTDGEFTLRVEWKPKDGEAKRFDRMFTRQEVFGPSYSGGQAMWRVQRRACDYARDIMRQVLAARGAIT